MTKDMSFFGCAQVNEGNLVSAKKGSIQPPLTIVMAFPFLSLAGLRSKTLAMDMTFPLGGPTGNEGSLEICCFCSTFSIRAKDLTKSNSFSFRNPPGIKGTLMGQNNVPPISLTIPVAIMDRNTKDTQCTFRLRK